MDYDKIQQTCYKFADLEQGLKTLMNTLEVVIEEQKKMRTDIVCISLRMDAINLECDELVQKKYEPQKK